MGNRFWAVAWLIGVAFFGGDVGRGEAGGASGAGRPRSQGTAPVVSVTTFLPAGYVTDGSVSYQSALQKALDVALTTERVMVVFPPMTYRLDDPTGLRVHSGTTLLLHGAVFQLDDAVRRDGQAFFAKEVTDVTFLGGEIVGRRDQWPDDVNVAGIRIRGRSARIRIRDMVLRDLSSNGIGLFGSGEKAMIEDVWVENVVVRNCCNKYVDYLQPHPGPVKGSVREDQGGIAFYFVRNFVVRGCSLEGSRSDGTHFYRCRDGRFVDNRVIGSKMGGYFVETCHYVLAANNIIRGNGSRGVTIERGSRFC
ncbi:MAG TPA: right-handed parallel beta-helix repeat-containing protein, partial [Planctomycetaceae bacterium]|nr:right-handed parallel beta-helix repeat-containing protein [Planctomycetaceae bacterium]